MSFDVTHRRVVVVGAGRSGQAAADLLVGRGAHVILADSRAAMPADAVALEAKGVRLEPGPHRADLCSDADLVVLSPGVPADIAPVARAAAAGVPVIGEIELAFRFLQGRVVAVTGTKGKSTTTTLIGRMLEAAGQIVTAGGNLGTALSSQVQLTRHDATHVVEVSSFQLETTRTFHPWIAVLVNLSPDHLDRHTSFDEYANAKGRIFANQTASDWAVVNRDDGAARTLATSVRARRFDFALDSPIDEGVTVESGFIVAKGPSGSTRIAPLSTVKLPGRHLLADVLAATAVAVLAGAPPDAIRRAIEHFGGLEHALETVADVDGVRFVNDSKATNVVSVRRAIESFESGVVVIMGGRYKGGDFGDLRDVLAARAVAVVTIGEASDLIAENLGQSVRIHRATGMADAVARAQAIAPRGGVVLLAPGCSSFDMFEDYRARGRAFKDAVRRLAEPAERV